MCLIHKTHKKPKSKRRKMIMLKKLIAIALSVMLAALPILSVNALADDSGAIDLTAPLDGFTQSELAASYSSSSPYQKGGFKAPTISGLGAKLFKDDGIDDYIRVEYTAEASATPNGGASLTDSDINVQGSGDNSVMTFDVTLRRNTNKHIYFYLLTESGSRETVMLWWNTDSQNRLWWGNSKHNTELALADNTWYKFKFCLDLKNKIYKLTLDGDKFDNVTHTCDSAKYAIPADVTYDGIGIGYLRPVANGDSFDIADAKVKNYGSVAYNEEITFENGTFADSESSAWANGSWKADANTSTVREKYFDESQQDYAVKLTPPSTGTAGTFWIEHIIGEGQRIGSDGTLGIEFSYFEHKFAQTRIYIKGLDANGTQKTMWPLSYSGYNWNYLFCGVDAPNDMPKDGENWRRVRITLDLESDIAKMDTWDETAPSGRAQAVTYDENKDALADFETITYVGFQILPRSWGDGRYMGLDDLRIYEVDSLQYIGSNPVSGTADGISLTDALAAEFNMPLADSALTNVTMTLEDSQGSTVSGTPSLNAKKTSIMFKPDYALNLEETYTFTISGTVYDIFGQSLSLDKTITFSTDELFDFKGCTFKQDSLEVASSGEIVGGKALTADVDIAINGGTPIGVAVALALYEKESGAYVASDVVYTDDKTNIDHTLSVNVPDDGYKYYPAVYVWDSLDNPAAFIEAIVLE